MELRPIYRLRSFNARNHIWEEQITNPLPAVVIRYSGVHGRRLPAPENKSETHILAIPHEVIRPPSIVEKVAMNSLG